MWLLVKAVPILSRVAKVERDRVRFVSVDPSFVRRWAHRRGLAPHLSSRGGIVLIPRGAHPAASISWEEFAGVFTVEALAFSYDDGAGDERWSIGPRLAPPRS